ncbi:hypothetical protein [Streptomyces sp. APSN-46.1]|nr:hypothetical protein [Streptomyces sp. APSN-46.1]
MGRTSSTRQRLQQAASGLCHDAVDPAGVEGPEIRRIALHGHG